MRSHCRSVHVVAVGCMCMMNACAGSDRGTLAEERITRGDTTIVRSHGGSVWDSVALVEEFRIGVLQGAEEEMFGNVQEIAPDRHGGVYVFDGAVPALRHFDSTGAYVGTLGAGGSGPGEYRDAALGLDVRPDGRVLMRDPRNSRINVYAADGTPTEHWTVSSGLFASDAMVVDTAGHLYLKVMLGDIVQNQPWPIGILHLGPTGELIDSIAPPTIVGEPTTSSGIFGTSKVWAMSPLGDMVAGVNDTYTFVIVQPDGRVVRIEREHTPVAVHPDEHAEWEIRNEWTRKNRGQFMSAELPPVPMTKPAYREFSIGGDGRIWVRLYVDARQEEVEPAPVRPGEASARPSITWVEPSVYDVFERDGTYLGRVHLPDQVSLAAHSGSEVWGRATGDLGELYIVRYRLDAR